MTKQNSDTLGNVVLAARQSEKEKTYWKNKLAGEPVRSRFPYDTAITGPGTSPRQTFSFEITGELFSKVTWIINGSDTLLHVILTAAVSLLLRKYSGNDDIIVASPIYKQEAEGDFINTCLILRNKLEKNMSFKELLLQVRNTVNEAVEHQNYPLEAIYFDLNLGGSESGFQLFETVILLENIHAPEYIEHIGRNVLFSFFRADGALRGAVEYNGLKYRESTVRRIVASFIRLLEQILFNVDMPLDDAVALTDDEKEILTLRFNGRQLPYPREKTIRQLFEEQVEQSPDRVAVVYENQRVTYRELNLRANRLARLLRARGLRPNDVAGILIPRSTGMIVGILGVLKAGGAYLPIDTTSPLNRILSVLEDSEPVHLVLTEEIVRRYAYMSFLSPGTVDAGHVKTPPRPPVSDPDSLPFPDRSMADFEKYNRGSQPAPVKNRIMLRGTRGCAYTCAFCSKTAAGECVTRSAGNIFEEILLFHRMGGRRFAFADDAFNTDVSNAVKVFERIIREGVNLELELSLRGDILTPEFVDLMVEAGTVKVTLSLETASPRLQKLIATHINLERFRENVTYLCEKYPGVILELNTLHGIPTETRDEARMTLDFIKSIKWVHFPYLHVLRIEENTAMEKIALRNGISKEAIERSEHLAYGEWPETLPFDQSFSQQCRAEFVHEYILSKERLRHVLPFQMNVFTEEELLRKYRAYDLDGIHCLDDLLNLAGIKREELPEAGCRPQQETLVPDFNRKLKEAFPGEAPGEDALNVLLLDLSHAFSPEQEIPGEEVEPSLPSMSLAACLKQRFPGKLEIKMAGARLDFDNYARLKNLLERFKPGVIGVWGRNRVKDFFHKTIGLIRQWGCDAPIIGAGAYASLHYLTALRDPNIDLLVLEEEENSFSEAVEKMLLNHRQLPGEEVLKEIPGLAFSPAGKDRETPGTGIVLLDDAVSETPGTPGTNPEPVNRPEDLAYVIYTSGSTGKPKGVMIRDQSVNNLVAGLKERIYKPYHPGVSVGLVAPYVFDASIKQIFASLLLGHTLVVVPEEIRTDGMSLSNFYRKHQVEIIDGTPTHLRLLREISGEGGTIRGFNPLHFVIGGEAFPGNLARQVLEMFGGDCKMTNVYGPTECSDVVSCFDVTPENASGHDILPIGEPMPNTRLYILDHRDRMQPTGVVGELCVAGDGLANGYLNRDELTAEKFTPHPFEPGTRIYRTGDLARWLEDGNIEFIGRNDEQIKVRGFRVEPGEIETQLAKIDDIKETVVVGGKDGGGDTYLCAYVVPRSHDLKSVSLVSNSQPFHYEKVSYKYGQFDLSHAGLDGGLFVSEELLRYSVEKDGGTFVGHFERLAGEALNSTALKAGQDVLSYGTLKRRADRLAALIDAGYDDRFALSGDEYVRYARQLLLDQWGIESQEKLKSTTVFIAGAGGIGSQVIQQLAFLGVGTLVICDFDVVELSNLNRQSLHDLSRLGMNKAESAKMTVERINPHVDVVVITEKVEGDTILDFLGDSKIIFDCLDDLEAKFVLSEAAVAKGIPHILSGMIEINSFAAVLHAPKTPCFHCLYDRSKVNEINELRNVVGNYQKKPFPVSIPALFITTGLVCNEAVKVLLGFENPAYNKFFFSNQTGSPALVDTEGYKQMTFAFNDHFKRISKEQGFDWDVCWRGIYLEELTVEPDPECPMCADLRRQQGSGEAAAAPAVDTSEPGHGGAAGGYRGESPSAEPGRLQPVVSLVTRGVGSMTALLGTLKAGKTFVPLDLALPPQKASYIIEDLGARLILTDNDNLELAKDIRDIANKGLPVINIDEAAGNDGGSVEGLNLEIHPQRTAYLSPRYNARYQDIPLTPRGLREFLLNELPDYMVPNYFMEIDRVPLTPNGKLDRNALPEPRLGDTGDDYTAPETPTEKKIAEIWSDVLGVEPEKVGVHSNFFELGGHSLRATSLIARINKELQATMPLADIFRAPTVKEMAISIEQLRVNGLGDVDNNLAQLKMESGASGNLFLVHDVSGNIDGYLEFCHLLETGLNTWGIRADLDKYAAPSGVGLEVIAAGYIEKIKEIQPQGPYHVAGWSLGGSIAYEMVRQLEEKGDQVDFLALFDSVGPGGFERHEGPAFTLRSERELVGRFATGNPQLESGLEQVTEIEPLWDLVAGHFEAMGPGAEIAKNAVREFVDHEIADYDTLGIRDVIKHLNMNRTFTRSLSTYNPGGKINTPIHYFKALESVIETRWDDYAEKPVHHYDVEGDHFTIFQQPGVVPFARLFSEVITRELKGESK